MSRRTRLLTLCAVLAAAALAVALWPEPPRQGEPASAGASPTPASQVERWWGRLRSQPGEQAPRPDAGRTDTFLLVVDAAGGQPLAGASVWLTPEATRGHHSRFPEATATTDSQGRAAFPGLPVEPYELSVSLDYFHPVHSAFAPGATVALERIPALHGVVLSAARAPVAGALVSSTGHSRASTRSGPDGRFALLVPLLGELVAEKDGLVAVSEDVSRERAESGQPLELVVEDLEVEPHRVVERSGAPLGAVHVETRLGDVRLHQTTRADGLFSVPVLADTFIAVVLSKEGYAPERRTFYGVRHRSADVVLSRPTRLEGEVVDLSGRPLPGAWVHIRWEQSHLDPRAEPKLADARGRFAFEGLSEPLVQLAATPPGRDEQPTEAEVELPEGTTHQVRLVVPPLRERVPIEVVTASGRLVREFLLTAAPVPPQGWTTTASRFKPLELNRGRFEVHVASADGRWLDTVLDVDPRPDMAPVRLVVHGDGGQEFEDELSAVRVPVLAVSPAGQPVGGAEVQCYDARGVTGDDGRFDCEVHGGHAAWPIHVLVRKDGQTGLARATGKEGEVRVVVAPTGTLRGRIDGPLPSGPVVLRLRNADGFSEHPLEGNSFAIEGRAPIRTFVCAVHATDLDHETPIVLGCAVSEALEEVVIPLGKEGRLHFRAADASGPLVEGLVVYVDRLQRQFDALDGVVQLALPPGQHVLVLNQQGSRARHEARFSIRSEQVTDLGRLELK